MDYLIAIDIQVSQYFFEIGGVLPPAVVLFFATYLIWLMVFFIMLLSWRYGKRKRLFDFVLQAGIAAFAALGVNNVINWFHFRARPFVGLNLDSIVNISALDNSFPSDHAVISWALATAVFLRNKKIGALFLMAAFFVSFGRMLAGVHYLSDIVVGAFVGVAVAWLVRWYIAYRERRGLRRFIPFLSA